MTKHKTEDYKISAIKYYLNNDKGDGYKKTCKIFDCKKSTLRDWIKRYNTSKNLTRKNRKPISYFGDPELGMIFTCVIVGALHKYGYDIHIAAIDRSDMIMINKIPSISIFVRLFVCSFVRLFGIGFCF